MTEPSTSHVEQQIAARIAAARIKVQAAKERRDDLAAARGRGLAHRHARKLRNLAEQEQRAQQQTLDDEPATSPRAGGSGAEPAEDGHQMRNAMTDFATTPDPDEDGHDDDGGGLDDEDGQDHDERYGCA